jgi:hypothetical protein
MISLKIVAPVLILAIVFGGILAGCDPDVKTTTPPAANSLSAAWCQETVSKIKDSQPGEIPRNFRENDSSKVGGEFDVNTYFASFPHLSMEEGYVLDYVYDFNGSGGAPLLYVRSVDAVPYKNYEEFAAAANEFTVPENELDRIWLVMGEENTLNGNRIKIDGTSEGYFEYTVLEMLGGQFYLFWHSNYNDNRIVCQPAELESILQSIDNAGFKPIDNGFKKDARKLNLQPVIETSGDKVTVSVVVFTMWGGFFRQSFTMYRNYPHTVIGFENEPLLEYQCGIMF